MPPKVATGLDRPGRRFRAQGPLSVGPDVRQSIRPNTADPHSRQVRTDGCDVVWVARDDKRHRSRGTDGHDVGGGEGLAALARLMQQRSDEEREALVGRLHQNSPPAELAAEKLMNSGRPGLTPSHLGEGDSGTADLTTAFDSATKQRPKRGVRHDLVDAGCVEDDPLDGHAAEDSGPNTSSRSRSAAANSSGPGAP